LITVEEFVPELEDAYEEFVRGRRGTLFYHGTKFRRLLRALLGADERSLVALERRAVRGAVPLLSLDGAGGRVYNSLPYYGSNGGIVADSPEAHDALAAAYNELALSAGTLAATIVPNPFGPGSAEGVAATLSDERIAQFTPLPRGGDHRAAVLAAADASARRNVRKAERLGIEVTRDPGALGRLHEIHDANIRALGGLPKERRFFELVGELFESGPEYDVYVAGLEGETIGALLVFYWGGSVEYYTPAIMHEHRSDQPLAAILATALADAGARGFELWNWGGTWLGQESLHRFKRKWGARERRYVYATQLNDESILERTPSEILSAFPNFYVVPFAALRQPEGAR
jgi:hypothetical protein